MLCERGSSSSLRDEWGGEIKFECYVRGEVRGVAGQIFSEIENNFYSFKIR